MYHKLYQHRLLAPLCQNLGFLNYFVCIKGGGEILLFVVVDSSF